MLTKYSKDSKLIAMSSNKILSFKFYSLKVGIKNFMDWLVNNIRLAKKLTCMWKI